MDVVMEACTRCKPVSRRLPGSVSSGEEVTLTLGVDEECTWEGHTVSIPGKGYTQARVQTEGEVWFAHRMKSGASLCCCVPCKMMCVIVFGSKL